MTHTEEKLLARIEANEIAIKKIKKKRSKHLSDSEKVMWISDIEEENKAIQSAIDTNTELLEALKKVDRSLNSKGKLVPELQETHIAVIQAIKKAEGE